MHEKVPNAFPGQACNIRYQGNLSRLIILLAAHHETTANIFCVAFITDELRWAVAYQFTVGGGFTAAATVTLRGRLRLYRQFGHWLCPNPHIRLSFSAAAQDDPGCRAKAAFCHSAALSRHWVCLGRFRA